MLTETNGFSILFKGTDSNALARVFLMIIHRSTLSKGKTVGTETYTAYSILNCWIKGFFEQSNEFKTILVQ